MGWFGALTIGRKLVVIAAAVAVAAALVWGVKALVDSIKDAGRAEVRAEWNAEKAGRASVKAEVQQAIGAALTPQFDQLADRISAIDRTAATVSVRLPAAIAQAPRYRDPACALTDDVKGQINAARALSSPDPVQ